MSALLRAFETLVGELVARLDTSPAQRAEPA
jgi:hypothetical protein